MVPRRSHTKSRNGCDQCKKRRVKCNEQGPPCSNCISRELDCTYMKAPLARGLTNALLESSSLMQPFKVEPQTANQLVLAAQSNGPKLFGLRDLELMHKFSTETYQSLCSNPSEHHVWRTVIPRKAFECDFLLSGILAIAALHTAATLEPPAALDYLDTALQHHNMALAPYRRALESLTPLNYDAVFAHALLTIAIGIALPQLTAKKHESSSMTESIFVLFGLLQGVNEISRIGRPWLDTEFFEYKRGFWEDYPLIPHLENDTEAALNRLEAMNDDVSALVGANQHRINKDAISLLRCCFARFERRKDAASVLTWLTVVDKEFVHGLRRRQPFPLLILMHWAVLLGELDGQIWWAQNSGKALVSELLVALCPDDDFEWNSAQRWVQQKLGL